MVSMSDLLETMAAAVSEKEKETSTKLQAEIEMKQTLEEQMMAHREQHQKQLSTLREEIADKQDTIDGLKEWVFCPGNRKCKSLLDEQNGLVAFYTKLLQRVYINLKCKFSSDEENGLVAFSTEFCSWFI